MRNSKVIRFGGKEIAVKELTCGELDELLGGDQHKVTWLDRILEKDILTGGILAMSTGIAESELSTMTPSAIRPLVVACKEVNPDFFETARRDLEKSRRAQEAILKLGRNSESAPVRS